jgi:hypothetical protein
VGTRAAGRSIAAMTARALICLVAVAVAGALVGSGLASLAKAPPNDPCLDFGSLPEGASSAGSLDLWPLTQRCEYRVGGGVARTTTFGPAVAELYAWIAAAWALAAFTVWRRGSAIARGAAIAAVLLALAAPAWFSVGANGAFFVPLLLGPPLAFALDHRLRPPGLRSRRVSMHVAVVLAAVGFCAILGVLAFGTAGVAFGVLAGAAASGALERRRRVSAILT